MACCVGSADAAAEGRPPDGRASASEMAGARSPTALAPQPARKGEAACAPEEAHTCSSEPPNLPS